HYLYAELSKIIAKFNNYISEKESSSLRENFKAKCANTLNQKEITNIKLPLFKKMMLQENFQIAIMQLHLWIQISQVEIRLEKSFTKAQL
ncbi:45782_t:CDS:1, partial [Gigaspora margarita]